MRPRICSYSRTYDTLDESDKLNLCRSDLVIGMWRPEHLADIRRRGLPRTIPILPCLQPQYVAPWDGRDDWWLPDVAWSIERAMQKACFENDWYLYDTSGRICSPNDPSHRVYVNWTRDCPNGRYGDAAGLHVSEWYAMKLGQLSSTWSWQSRTTWSGIMWEILFDNLGAVSGTSLRYADPNRDGYPEGVCILDGNTTTQPLTNRMRIENALFRQYLRRRLHPGMVELINNNGPIQGPSWRVQCAGVKMENFLRDGRGWDSWVWSGDPAYFARPDTSKSIVYITRDGRKSDAQNLSLMRLGLGTALLGEGYFCWTPARQEEGAEYRVPWHPLFDLDLGIPEMPCWKTSFGSVGSIYYRPYSNYMVSVNPGWTEIAGVPARDATFTRRLMEV